MTCHKDLFSNAIQVLKCFVFEQVSSFNVVVNRRYKSTKLPACKLIEVKGFYFFS